MRHHEKPVRLRRDIAWVLAFKLAALTLLYLLFFGPAHRVAVSPERIAALLIGTAQSHPEH